MPSLPVSTDLTGSAITEAQAKTWFTQLRDFLSGLLGTAGTVQTALATLQVPFARGLLWVAGAYSVTTADRGKVLGIGAAVTVTLPAAATAGSGFMVAVRAFANGAVVDGYGAEVIDGAASITLNAGESAILVCNGGEWWTVGRTVAVAYPISVANGGTGATNWFAACNNLGAVKIDQGHGAIGSFVFAVIDDPGATATTVNPEATVSGAWLKPAGVNHTTTDVSGTTMSGTWRCLGYAKEDSGLGQRATLWQRIA